MTDRRQATPPLPLHIRGLARACAALYPARFREEHGTEYLEGVRHRWDKERIRGLGATLRTAAVLLGDAWRSRALWRPAAYGQLPRRGAVGPGGALLADLRIAVRTNARRPWLALLIVGTLGVGIGSSVLLFGTLDRFVLHPLPHPDGDRMVYVGMEHRRTGFLSSPSQPVLDRWRGGSRTLERIEAFSRRASVVSDGRSAERVDRIEVSHGLPEMISLRPVLGRPLGPLDATPDAEPVVVIGERRWRSVHGSDATILGEAIAINDTLFTVVGVWPSDAPLDTRGEPGLYTVLPTGREANPSRLTRVLALTAPGVDAAAVEAELSGLLAGLDESPGTYSAVHEPVVQAPPELLGRTFVTGLWVAWGGTVLLLLVALANGVSLLLARAVTREPEVGVRLALGASGWSVFRLLLMEAAVLASTGALAGMLLAQLVAPVLASLASAPIPDLGSTPLNRRAIELGAALTLIASLVCAAMPAAHFRSTDVNRLIGGSGTTLPRKRHLGAALVTLQVGLAMLLAVGAGLATRSLTRLAGEDPGFDLDQIVMVSISLPTNRYPDPATRLEFWDRVEGTFRSIRGVTGLATTGAPPFSFSIVGVEPYLESEDPPFLAPDGWTSQSSAGPDYFDLLGIPILEGRGFGEDDVRPGPDSELPVPVVVNEAFAAQRAESVVGRSLIVFPDAEVRFEIVGVVGNVRAHGLGDGVERTQYWVADRRDGSSYQNYVIRTELDPGAALAAARARLAELDPSLTFASARTGQEVRRDQTADQRFLAVLLAGSGGVSLLVALLGVYGSVSLGVSQRAREMGLRRALGAGTGRVLQHVLLGGLQPVMAGLLLGGGGALVLGRYIAPALYEIGPTDPLTFVTSFVLLSATAVAACLVPARRATRVDPARTLKVE